jgi:hypothetical protein
VSLRDNMATYSEPAAFHLAVRTSRQQPGKVFHFASPVASLGVVVIVSAFFVLVSDQCRHWFVLPIGICGFIMLSEAMPWFQGRVDILNPRAVLGVYGVFFFWLAPLLHVGFSVWMEYVIPPDDWRPWLGGMAAINLVGLLAYKWCLGSERRAPVRQRRTWRLESHRFWTLLALACAISLTAQSYLWIKTGGLAGYAAQYSVSLATHYDPLAGLGWVVVIGESFPMLLFIAFVVVRRRCTHTGWSIIALALLSAIGLQFLFGGFRGSRANTVWFALWAIGAVHCCVRRTPRVLIYAATAVGLVFMFLSGFAKDLGFESATLAGDSDQISLLESKTRRTPIGMLLGDFGRSDVQAYELYRQATDSGNVPLAWGTTYLGALATLVPQTLWPGRLPGKTKWATDMEYGGGSYPIRRSSRIYGLTGEFGLNFSYWGASLPFIALAWTVRATDKWYATMPGSDARLILFPLVVPSCIMLLAFDSDNLVWFFFKFIAPPLAVILLSSIRAPQFRRRALAALPLDRAGQLIRRMAHPTVRSSN